MSFLLWGMEYQTHQTTRKTENKQINKKKGLRIRGLAQGQAILEGLGGCSHAPRVLGPHLTRT